MSESTDLLLEQLEAILTTLERISRRDFQATEDGIDRMDAICMSLIAVGETLKRIDRQTEGRFFARYPQVQWRGAIGLRDVLAHGYFDIDVEQLYAICAERIPGLIETVKQAIADLKNPPSSPTTAH